MSIEIVLAAMTLLAAGPVGTTDGARGRDVASSQPANAPEPSSQPCSCACAREPQTPHRSAASPNDGLDLGETASWPSN
ncbi:MAG TPA: hypothetical protein VIV57_24515 [Anaeromyxobacter sp.]